MSADLIQALSTPLAHCDDSLSCFHDLHAPHLPPHGSAELLKRTAIERPCRTGLAGCQSLNERSLAGHTREPRSSTGRPHGNLHLEALRGAEPVVAAQHLRMRLQRHNLLIIPSQPSCMFATRPDMSSSSPLLRVQPHIFKQYEHLAAIQAGQSAASPVVQSSGCKRRLNSAAQCVQVGRASCTCAEILTVYPFTQWLGPPWRDKYDHLGKRGGLNV